MVKANDRGQVSPDVVADRLAGLNYEVSQRISDNSVGPRCIVAWRHKTGGGENWFYTGTTRDTNSPALPTLARVIDIEALVALEMPHMLKMLEAMRAGEPRWKRTRMKQMQGWLVSRTNPTKIFVSAYTLTVARRPARSGLRASWCLPGGPQPDMSMVFGFAARLCCPTCQWITVGGGTGTGGLLGPAARGLRRAIAASRTEVVRASAAGGGNGGALKGQNPIGGWPLRVESRCGAVTLG